MLEIWKPTETLLLFFNLSRTDSNKNTLCFISSEKPQTNVRMGKVCRQNKQMAFVRWFNKNFTCQHNYEISTLFKYKAF